MSNPKDKHKRNVKGKFYCTDPADMDGCIACGVCSNMAPEFFDEDDDGNHFVYKQPVGEHEESLCQEALEACPVESIGDDGDGDE